MFKRRNYGNPLPGKKSVRAHLDFLNSVKDDNPIKQCEDCIYSQSNTSVDWCGIHWLAPTGICLEKNKEL